MRQRTLVVSSIVAAVIAAGCSQKPETTITDATEAVEVAAQQEAESLSGEATQSLVEVNASTRPIDTAEQRPIKLPTLDFEKTTDATDTESFFEDAVAYSPVKNTSGTRLRQTYRTGPTRYAPSYPERPVPSNGMSMSEVLASAGEPASRMSGTGSEVWDYGTYRVFFDEQKVAFTRVW